MLRIPQLVFAINKMDLVEWSEARFRTIEAELRELAKQLEIPSIAFIPMSALTGANVVDRAPELAWHHGPTLLEYLENVPVNRAVNDARFPVQWVIRPQSDEHHDYRGYAGQVAGGVLRPGDEVVVLPSGRTTKISKIEEGGVAIETAFAPMSVVVHLADDVDVGRGDLIARIGQPPRVSQELEAMVCWMTDKPLSPRSRYALKHTTRWTRAIVSEVVHRLDINTGELDTEAKDLGLNALGRIKLRTTSPVVYDPYTQNRITGSFILVDETTNATVAAGMLLPGVPGSEWSV
jgi:sulfate adenylyltransferase subunit 1 (EFTu-like GTPase family)